MRVSIITLLAILMLCTSLTGCSTLSDRAVVGLEANEVLKMRMDLERRYFEVSTLISSVQDASVQEGKPVFNDKEWSILSNVDENVDLILTSLETVRTADDLIADAETVYELWELIVISYQDASYVVEQHADAFSTAQEVKLRVFNEIAKQDGDRITKLLKNPTEENLKEAFFIAKDVLSTSLDMLKILGVTL